MKTLAYNTGKQIMTSIFALVLFTTLSTKAQEHPSDSSYAKFDANVFELKNFMMDSKITEPAKDSKLLNELKSWMSNGSYWETVAEAIPANDELMRMLSEWMKDGSYWQDNRDDNINDENFTEPVAAMEEE